MSGCVSDPHGAIGIEDKGPKGKLLLGARPDLRITLHDTTPTKVDRHRGMLTGMIDFHEDLLFSPTNFACGGPDLDL